MSEPETLEQIAERLAGQMFEPYHFVESDVFRFKTELILAALREVEARGEQRAAVLGGALLDSAVERAEKAEAEVERLKEMLRHYGMVCDNPDQCLLDDDTKEQP